MTRSGVGGNKTPGNQVVRVRQVRRDLAIAADRRRGEQQTEEHARAAFERCRAGKHSRIKMSDLPRFCVWCGELG